MICTREDEFTSEQYEKLARWFVRLSNNQIVIQDDGRPGLEYHSAWMRLKSYLKDSKLKIDKFWVEFRSHRLHNILPEKADGYFFCKSAAGIWGMKDTLEFYLLGHIKNGILHVQKWHVPA